MKVEADELVFFRENGPRNLAALIHETTGINRSTINNELTRIKSNYNPKVIGEARRIIKALKGIEYTSRVTA
ncbi:hypothetical protein FW774_06065 [Pedobacter sp. BS3]|uniref:hypothetical protein n=1 Tax=Pedobacter sp. BS3 TaxID=2567937 RepID=UPI0011ED8685|nr:hypothetical protein [Pedobacter sp. BS3]TZF84550.1 hypothetical protein FW774_06065 [Pedobacter sp. BS3]